MLTRVWRVAFLGGVLLHSAWLCATWLILYFSRCFVNLPICLVKYTGLILNWHEYFS